MIKYDEWKSKKQKEYGRHGIEIGRYLFCFDDTQYNHKYDEWLKIFIDILYISNIYFHECEYLTDKPITKMGLINKFAHHSYFRIIDDKNEDFSVIFDYLHKIFIKDDEIEFIVFDYSKSAFSKEYIAANHKISRKGKLYNNVLNLLVELDEKLENATQKNN